MRPSLEDPQLLNISKKKLLQLAAQYHRQILHDQEVRAESYAKNRTGYREDWEDYCIHGAYIGDPYGADFMCFICEGGYSDLEYALGEARGEVYRAQQRHRDLIKRLVTYNEVISAILERNGYLELGFLSGYQDTVEEILEIEKRWKK